MLPGDDAECFFGEPADTFNFTGQQQSRIYGNDHLLH
jgi:hypothetical protein